MGKAIEDLIVSTETKSASGFAFTRCATAHKGVVCCKRFRRLPDGTVEKFPYPDGAAYWFFRPTRAANIADMATTLRRQAQRQAEMLVMGEPVADLDMRFSHRRLWARDKGNTLTDVRRRWLVIDVDDQPVPDKLGLVENLARCGVYIRDVSLPPEFHGVLCIVTPTASTGKHPSSARLRLWFLLERPILLSQLHAWGVAAKKSGVNVDPSLFQPGQPVYTARPAYAGLPDPIPAALHATILGGEKERVPLELARFDAQKSTAFRPAARLPAGWRFTHAARLGLSVWRECMIAEVGGTEGYFAPLTRALGLAAQSGDSDDDICSLVADLLAERADAGRRRRYGPEWVASTLRSFRMKDEDRSARIAAGRARLFMSSPADETGRFGKEF